MGRLRINEPKLGHMLGTTATQVHRWRYGEDEIPPSISDYLRTLEVVDDLAMYGASFAMVKADGSRSRVEPSDVYLQADGEVA